MDAPRAHSANEQPLRESDRSETKAQQDQPGVLVYLYPQSCLFLSNARLTRK
jgi:hypothetical protein